MKKTNVKLDITKILIAATAITAVVLVGKGISFQPVIASNNEIAAKLAEDIKNETRTIEELNAVIESAGTDEYIEKIAREKLGMIRANEIVFIDLSGQQ